MVHGKVWPAHPKPLPDELLSSWIVRVAEANAIKLQTLSWMLFGNSRSPWNRDIDRNAPPWLIQALSKHTGTNYWEVFHTALVTYRTRLYPRRQSSGQLRWILPVRNYGMRHRGLGQQFCSACLAADAIPYFRKQWRGALFTYCPEHQTRLRDACPGCGLPVMHYRGDFGREMWEAYPLHVCHACGCDFRETEGEPACFPDTEVHQLFNGMLQSLNRPSDQAGQFDLGFFSVLHQLCFMLGARPNQGKLQRFVAGQLGMPIPPSSSKRLTFEQHSQDERHQYLLCALWLMGDLQHRLRAAWLAKTVHYNLMLKDFEGAPRCYRSLVKAFSNWRRPTFG